MNTISANIACRRIHHEYNQFQLNLLFLLTNMKTMTQPVERTHYRIHPNDPAPAGYNRRLRAVYRRLEGICRDFRVDVLKVEATRRGGDGSAHASNVPLGSRGE